MIVLSSLFSWVLFLAKHKYRYVVVLLNIFIFLGIATRSKYATPDTDNYIDFINFGSSNGGLHDAEFLASKVFQFFSTFLSGELFIFFSVLIPFILLINVIDNGRTSRSYFFPIIYISTIYGFDLMTNAIRQNIALVFSLWALVSLRHFMLKILVLLGAALFHKSAAIILILFVIFRRFRPLLCSLSLMAGSVIVTLCMLSKGHVLSLFYILTNMLAGFAPAAFSEILDRLVFLATLDREMFSGVAHYFVYSGMIILSGFLYYSYKVAGQSWPSNVKVMYAISCYGLFIVSMTSPLIIFYRFFYIIYPLMIYVIYFSFEHFHHNIKRLGTVFCIFSLLVVLTRASMNEFFLYGFYN